MFFLFIDIDKLNSLNERIQTDFEVTSLFPVSMTLMMVIMMMMMTIDDDDDDDDIDDDND